MTTTKTTTTTTTRIRVADVRAQVLDTARRDELAVVAASNASSARGNDVISKKEQQALAADLKDAVNEVRRREPGKTVQVDEVVAVLGERFDAAVAGVNQPAGSGRPFLSKEERRNLVERAPLLGGRVQRAIDLLLNPVVIPPTPPEGRTGADVHARLSSLVGPFYFDGLFGSEGGEPVSAVLVPGPLSSPPTADELARALGHDPTTDAGFVQRWRALDDAVLEEFLGQQSAPAADVEEVGALLRGLSDLRVLIVGKDGAPGVDPNHPTYLLGTAADGSVVGLKTGVIWT